MANNVLYKVLLNIFNIAIPLIIGPYAFRVLGPDYMGRITHVESIYNYFYIFALFGIYQYGLREMSRIRRDKAKLKSLFTSLFVTGIISNLTVVVFYIAFAYAKYGATVKYPVLMIYSINIFANMLYVEWANEALERYGFITIKTIVIKSLYIAALLMFVRSPEQYLNYVLFLTLSTFLNNLVSFIFIIKDIGLDFKEFYIKKHIKFLFVAVVMSNANLLYTQLDRVMIGSYINEASVSYYTLGQNIVGMVNTLILSVVYVALPRISNILGNDDEKAYVNILNKISQCLFVFLFPAAVGIICLAREIVLIYGGSKFVSSVTVLQMFAVYMISLGMESILTNHVLYVKRKEKILVIFIFSCGVLNLLLNIILIKLKLFTPLTAIATTCIANFTLIALEYAYIRLILKLRFNLFSFDKIKYFILSILFIPITMLVKAFVSGVILSSLVTIVFCGGIYIAFLFMMKDSIVMLVISKFKGRATR
jgi:O-antigen/teichoic acid export membrane protein